MKQEVVAYPENYQASYPDEDGNNMNYVSTSATGRRIRVVVNEKRRGHRVVISVMD